MSACGDSSHTGQGLTFNTSAPEQYDINKFKNADYLYESYFGEFNLPASFKDQISVELQMVANGFAVAEATGGDMAQKMRLFDTTVREMLGTREMKEEFEKIVKEDALPGENANTLFNKSESEINQGDSFTEDTPPIDDRPVVIDEGWEAYLEEQQKMVEEYNLPYPMPNSATKVLDLEQALTMSHKKKKKNPPPPCLYSSSTQIRSWRC